MESMGTLMVTRSLTLPTSTATESR
jgi:hypothetical protein